jgi:hypothetical protein
MIGRGGADPKYRHWTAAPARPIRYGLLARLSDWYQGRRDGADGLPDLQLIRDSGPAQTPSEQVIRLTGEVQTLSESLLFDRWRARHPREYGVEPLAAKLKDAEEHRDAKREALKAVSGDLSAEAKREWRSGERRTSSAVIASRRMAEHAARRRLAEDEYRAATERVATAHAELERAKVARDLDLDVQETRRRWIHRHGDRRAASFLRSLIRNHRAGAEMLDELSRRGRTTEGGST